MSYQVTFQWLPVSLRRKTQVPRMTYKTLRSAYLLHSPLLTSSLLLPQLPLFQHIGHLTLFKLVRYSPTLGFVLAAPSAETHFPWVVLKAHSLTFLKSLPKSLFSENYFNPLLNITTCLFILSILTQPMSLFLKSPYS